MEKEVSFLGGLADQNAGSVRHVRWAAYFGLDFFLACRQAGLPLSFDQAKESGVKNNLCQNASRK
ncbi:MAG: hypothetical protein DWQ44_00485 [Bacteroidetes bacterium]|nr:MAG: hypothetical protein DWQ33_03860 [Bacteroidota bacterium]REK07578.1 MAG: hypothetical protein DWQ39_01410 [Bacteroidota bacterium]REK36989.1 MAG: hypothetical protein DWQ44_00485 [Bacteroidota bacterium]REK47810.1 MAG: hypothetical protein DWQ48_11545 [Bacteroidota bacterium]